MPISFVLFYMLTETVVDFTPNAADSSSDGVYPRCEERDTALVPV